MIRKHIAFSLVLFAVFISAVSALASSAPTSQFGFTGWPYRQSTRCAPAATAEEPTAAPTVAPTLALIPEPTAVPTLKPTAEPTLAPTPSPTVVPTLKPTAAPTAIPTLKPTPAPTAVPTIRPTAKPTAVPSSVDDYTTVSITAQEQKALKLLNEDRIKNGLPELTADATLSSIARMKSEDMNKNHYFAHQSPTLGSASDMLRSNGYSFVSVGENIAHHSTVEKSQAAFMSSDGHRRNILGSQWKKVGIGVCYDKDGFVYVTQLFIR